MVGQTAAFLREQFHGLRLRELADDRAAAMSRAGDVFVTTWQTVATRVKDKRNVRKEGDTNPSIDTLVETLRAQGLRIGVVVDEAHHGFGKDTVAAKFFRDVLMPEYTVLITATPDDAEVKEFEEAMGIAELQRISVSRADVVDVGLIKKGVKCAAYFVEPEKRALVDLQGTALRDGVAAHRKLKQSLADLKVPLVPLLLVQADSTEKSVDKLRERLLRMGFTNEQIAVHTADEPDSGLLALANDETREVLVFKMAVALGFDAPRAFTLVSMRASRDPDFGVQLVGRILRVHRRLQGSRRPRRCRKRSATVMSSWRMPRPRRASISPDKRSTRFKRNTRRQARPPSPCASATGCRASEFWKRAGSCPCSDWKPARNRLRNMTKTRKARQRPRRSSFPPRLSTSARSSAAPRPSPMTASPRPRGLPKSQVLCRRTDTPCVRASRGDSRRRW